MATSVAASLVKLTVSGDGDARITFDVPASDAVRLASEVPSWTQALLTLTVGRDGSS